MVDGPAKMAAAAYVTTISGRKLRSVCDDIAGASRE
jgi:hypothetical protein